MTIGQGCTARRHIARDAGAAQRCAVLCRNHAAPLCHAALCRTASQRCSGVVDLTCHFASDALISDTCRLLLVRATLSRSRKNCATTFASTDKLSCNAANSATAALHRMLHRGLHIV